MAGIPVKMKKRHSKFHRDETVSKPFTQENQKILMERVEALVGSICSSEGIELVYLEFQREPDGRVLRIYIDKPEGLSLNDCVSVSRQLEDILDIELEDFGPYSLEVSSPGLERPLWKIQDYDRFKGREAKIKTRVAIDGRKNFKGFLMGVLDESVTLRMEGMEKAVTIPYNNIARARLVEH
jgi:ribosome maturation factor RimP